jgi:16S rRNA (guanine966-N2)-methyltransferase
MSIVQPWLSGAAVIDLFAGSGALGLEALSRGASHADFVEIAPKSIAALRENIAGLGAEASAHVHRADSLRFIQRLDVAAYAVAFADPPYGHGFAQAIIDRWLAVPFADVLGVEHEKKVQLPDHGDRRVYGDTALTFYYRANSGGP